MSDIILEIKTSKNELITRLEQSCNITLSNNITESYLYSFYVTNNYTTLFNDEKCLSNIDFINKSRFQGIIDNYFDSINLSNKLSNISCESSKFLKKQNNNISKKYSSQDIPLKIDEKTYPICGYACMDCCEDVCEHAICCNCQSTIYDYWHDGIDVGNYNIINNNPNPKNISKIKFRKLLKNKNINNNNYNDDELLYGCCHNPCEDCCEDILEHAICCNCYSYVISHWYEAMEIDQYNNINNNNNNVDIYNGDSFNNIKNSLNKNINNNKFKKYMYYLHKKKNENCKNKIIISLLLLFIIIIIIISLVIYFQYYYQY